MRGAGEGDVGVIYERPLTPPQLFYFPHLMGSVEAGGKKDVSGEGREGRTEGEGLTYYTNTT